MSYLTKKPAAFLCCLALLSHSVFLPWGFWAHKRINRLAVFRLPPEMAAFFKAHIEYLAENAVNPDKRRYAVAGEAERHFIDLDVYGDSAASLLPVYWDEAVEKFGEDSLRKHGIAPWHIQQCVSRLTAAFRRRDAAGILRQATDLGHYVADIHVPLHTTRNYNGQLTGQEGIHGFWESRLPELFSGDYDFWIGPAAYLENPAQQVWKAVFRTHAACDSVLKFEQTLTARFHPGKKYTYETRNNILVKTYSPEFSAAFHDLLRGQVERQMKASVRMIGDLWYTSWVNAGQPDLHGLVSPVSPLPAESDSISAPPRSLVVRPEPD